MYICQSSQSVAQVCLVFRRERLFVSLDYLLVSGLAWPLPALLFWLAEYCTRRRRVTTASGSSEGDEEEVFVPMEVERESSRIHPGQ